MTKLLSNLFGPLHKNSCVYFLIITVIFFVTLVIIVINELFYLLSNINRLKFRMITTTVIVSFNIFIAYFVNRLLYSMCIKSLD